MAGNVITTAKNSFSEGLLMDFSPTNSDKLANALTSALNATFLTYNGNEGSLLNDMGNGRVETAFLPEGYVPVGTCEFGDIIYVVSYNPLINKSLIGCFPSPERNISSEELGMNPVVLKSSEFLKLDADGNPTGQLISNSVRKVLFLNDMHPGDQYIIYSEETNWGKFVSDYGNTDKAKDLFPKFVKINIVSIEDSGKITYLNSNVKWYNNNFFIHEGVDYASDGKLDLDGYRTMTSSAYATFASKISGKLALLIELEKITGFNCTWDYRKIDDSTETDANGLTTEKGNLYFNFNWTTENKNINPDGVIISDLTWVKNEGTYKQGELTRKISELNPIDDKYIPFTRGYKLEEETQEEKKFTYADYLARCEYQGYSSKILETMLSTLNIKYINKVTNNIENNQFKCGEYFFNISSYESDEDGNIIYSYYDKDFILKQLHANVLNDDIVNNSLKYPITKLYNTFTIPTFYKEEKINKNNFICEYKVTPTMPYGKLDEFASKGSIDFSKIGEKNIELKSWKYYKQDNQLILNWTLDAYVETGKGIPEVIFEFYDGGGLAAAYHLDNYSSYSGSFTNYLELDHINLLSELNNLDWRGNDFIHVKRQLKLKELIADLDYYFKNESGETYIEAIKEIPTHAILNGNYIEAKYVYDFVNGIGVYRLAESNEVPEYALVDELTDMYKAAEYVYDETSNEFRKSIIETPEYANISGYIEADLIWDYSLNLFRTIHHYESATHVYDETTGEYRKPITGERGTHIWDSTIEKYSYVVAETPEVATHVWDASLEDGKGDYREANSDEVATHIWDEELNDYRLIKISTIATHIWDGTLNKYRLTKEGEVATHYCVQGDYRLRVSGDPVATHVWDPELNAYREKKRGETATHVYDESLGTYREAYKSELGTHANINGTYMQATHAMFNNKYYKISDYPGTGIYKAYVYVNDYYKANYKKIVTYVPDNENPTHQEKIIYRPAKFNETAEFIWDSVEEVFRPAYLNEIATHVKEVQYIQGITNTHREVITYETVDVGATHACVNNKYFPVNLIKFSLGNNYIKVTTDQFYKYDSKTSSYVKIEDLSKHNFDETCYLKVQGRYFEQKYNTPFYESDAGMLYSNWLYGVKIIVRYEQKNAIDLYIFNENPTVDYRWLWTNTAFNDYYFENEDFTNLKLNLFLDALPEITSTENWNLQENYYLFPNINEVLTINNKELGAIVQHINCGPVKKSNINLKVKPGLADTHDTFTLCGSSETHAHPLEDIHCDIILAEHSLKNYPEQPEPKLYSEGIQESELLDLTPQISPVLDGDPGYEGVVYGKTLGNILGTSYEELDMYDEGLDIKKYRNNFCINNNDFCNYEQFADKYENLIDYKLLFYDVPINLYTTCELLEKSMNIIDHADSKYINYEFTGEEYDYTIYSNGKLKTLENGTKLGHDYVIASDKVTPIYSVTAKNAYGLIHDVIEEATVPPGYSCYSNKDFTLDGDKLYVLVSSIINSTSGVAYLSSNITKADITYLDMQYNLYNAYWKSEKETLLEKYNAGNADNYYEDIADTEVYELELGKIIQLSENVYKVGDEWGYFVERAGAWIEWVDQNDSTNTGNVYKGDAITYHKGIITIFPELLEWEYNTQGRRKFYIQTGSLFVDSNNNWYQDIEKTKDETTGKYNYKAEYVGGTIVLELSGGTKTETVEGVGNLLSTKYADFKIVNYGKTNHKKCLQITPKLNNKFTIQCHNNVSLTDADHHAYDNLFTVSTKTVKTYTEQYNGVGSKVKVRQCVQDPNFNAINYNTGDLLFWKRGDTFKTNGVYVNNAQVIVSSEDETDTNVYLEYFNKRALNHREENYSNILKLNIVLKPDKWYYVTYNIVKSGYVDIFGEDHDLQKNNILICITEDCFDDTVDTTKIYKKYTTSSSYTQQVSVTNTNLKSGCVFKTTSPDKFDVNCELYLQLYGIDDDLVDSIYAIVSNVSIIEIKEFTNSNFIIFENMIEPTYYIGKAPKYSRNLENVYFKSSYNHKDTSQTTNVTKDCTFTINDKNITVNFPDNSEPFEYNYEERFVEENDDGYKVFISSIEGMSPLFFHDIRSQIYVQAGYEYVIESETPNTDVYWGISSDFALNVGSTLFYDYERFLDFCSDDTDSDPLECVNVRDHFGKFKAHRSGKLIILSEDKDLKISVFKRVSNVLTELLEYYDADGNLKLSTNYEVYKYNNKYNNLEKLRNSGLDLTLQGIHFSKFRTKTVNKPKQLPVITPYVYYESDLEHYNLQLLNGKPAFKKILFFSMNNRAWHSSHLLFMYKNVKWLWDNNTKASTEPFHTDYYSGGKDRSMSYWTLEGLNWNLLKYNMYFYPVLWGHWESGDRTLNKQFQRGDMTINMQWAWNAEISAKSTLGMVETREDGKPGHIWFSDDWRSDGIASHAKDWFNVVTNVYYKKKDEFKEKNNYVYENYGYLDDNYSIYNRDIMLRLYTNVEELNHLITIHGLDFVLYIDLVKKSMCIDDDMIPDSNVKLVLSGAIKVTPVNFRFDYKLPTFYIGDLGEDPGYYLNSVLGDGRILPPLKTDYNIPYILEGTNLIPFAKVGYVPNIDISWVELVDYPEEVYVHGNKVGNLKVNDIYRYAFHYAPESGGNFLRFYETRQEPSAYSLYSSHKNGKKSSKIYITDMPQGNEANNYKIFEAY